MVKYVSFLKGINVGGKHKILMADLKILYEQAGFKNIITYIQSGNVIFETEGNADLANKIEKIIAEKYGFSIAVIVRNRLEMQILISANPFIQNRAIEEEKLYCTLLLEKPLIAHLDKLQESNFEPDEFKIVGKTIYLNYKNKYSDSKLTNQFFESKLKTTATTRNWKTINHIYKLMSWQ